MSDRRGMTLVVALAAMLLTESLTLLALHAVLIRVRLTADARWRTEAALVAASALGSARVAHRADLDTLRDSVVVAFAPVVRGDGWSWHATAARTGALITLTVTLVRRGADSVVFAARRASLLLARDAADTVRVLAGRPRF